MESNFPNRLKEFRDITGLSKKEVAFLIDLKDAGKIGKWERGDSKPSLDQVLKLSIVYQTLVNNLYFDLHQEYKDQILKRREDLPTIQW